MRLHNDDVHTFEMVTTALMQLSLPRDVCVALTERVDSGGVAEVHQGAYASAIAIFSRLKAAGLLVSLVPVARLEAEARAVQAMGWLRALAEKHKPLATIAGHALVRAASDGRAACTADEAATPAGPAQDAECWQHLEAAGLTAAQKRVVARAEQSIASGHGNAQRDAQLASGVERGVRSVEAASERALDAEQGTTDDVASAARTRESPLRALVRVDPLLPHALVTDLHTLYLSCLPDLVFKRAFAMALGGVYFSLAVQFAAGVGTHNDSLFRFSVQLLTTPSLVHMLMRHGILMRALLALDFILHSAAVQRPERSASPALHAASTASAQFGVAAEESDASAGLDARASPTPPSGEMPTPLIDDWPPPATEALPPLDCEATPLRHRRYDYVVRDLEYILAIDGVSRALAGASAPLEIWLRILSRVQAADPQLRYVTAHIEHDSRTWVQAFNLHISLSSTFSSILKSLTDLLPPQDATGAAVNGLLHPPAFQEGTSTSANASPSVVAEAIEVAASLGGTTLLSLRRWLGLQTLTRVLQPLPSGGATAGQMVQPVVALLDGDVMQGASFHIPLHRFLAALVREALAVDTTSNAQIVAAACGGRCSPMSASRGPSEGERTRPPPFNAAFWRRAMEHPVRVSALCAQVTAGMWKRNGLAMVNQLLNYAAPPLCIRFRDLDLHCLQICLAQLIAADDEVEGASDGIFTDGNLAASASAAAALAPLMPYDDQRSCDAEEPTDRSHRARVASPNGHESSDDEEWRLAQLHSDETDDATRFLPLPYLVATRGARYFVLSLAHKFGLYRWLLLSNGGVRAEALAAVGRLRTERAADDTQRLALSEELLWLLVVLLTELPRPAGTHSHALTLRREIVHRLAAQPCTRSELSDCAEHCSHPKLVRGEPLDAVLRAVATRRAAPIDLAATSGRTPRYELKPEIMETEYDPEFWHLSAQAHKQVGERRRRSVKAASTATAAPSTAASPASSGVGEPPSFSASAHEPASIATPAPTPLPAHLPHVGPPPVAHVALARARLLLYEAELVGLTRSALARALLWAMPFGSPHPPPSSAVICAAALCSRSLPLSGEAAVATAATAASGGMAGALSEAAPAAVDAGPAASMATSGPEHGTPQSRPWSAEETGAVRAASRECSEKLLARAVHLLTLMLHCATEGSDHAAVQLPAAQREAFFAMLCSQPGRLAAEREPTSDDTAREDATAGRHTELGRGGSVLELLRAITRLDAQSQTVVGSHIQGSCHWLLTAMRGASRSCAVLLEEFEAAERKAAEEVAAPQAGTNVARAERLERKRRAQQRALAQLAKQASGFIESLAGEDGGSEAKPAATVSTAEPSTSPDDDGLRVCTDAARTAALCEVPLCIICHTHDPMPIGYICCSQPSAVLRHDTEPVLGRSRRTPSTDAAPAMASGSPNATRSSSMYALSPPLALPHALIRDPVDGPQQVLGFCGHAVHRDCFSQYIGTLHERAASSDHFEGKSAIHVSEGEFLCPMCKRHSNALVPHLGPTLSELKLVDRSLNEKSAVSATRLSAATVELEAGKALGLAPLRAAVSDALLPNDPRWSWPGFRASDVRGQQGTCTAAGGAAAESALEQDQPDLSRDALAAAYGEDLAERLTCPITGELMHDPVVAADGVVYDRPAIEAWLEGHDTSPRTGGQLEHCRVESDVSIRAEVEELLARMWMKSSDSAADAPAAVLWWLRQSALQQCATSIGRLAMRPCPAGVTGGGDDRKAAGLRALLAWLQAPTCRDAIGEARKATSDFIGQSPADGGDSAAPGESDWMWSWVARPTVARLTSITRFAEALDRSRRAKWANSSSSTIGEEPFQPPISWGVNGASTSEGHLLSESAPGYGDHSDGLQQLLRTGNEDIPVASQLLSALAYTLSMRVALFCHVGGKSPLDVSGSVPQESVNWSAVDGQLRASKPLQNLLHAVRLVIAANSPDPCGIGNAIRSLLATGTPPDDGQYLSREQLPALLRRPLLRSDGFDVLIVVYTICHGPADLRCAVCVCAMAVVVREIIMLVIEATSDARADAVDDAVDVPVCSQCDSEATSTQAASLGPGLDDARLSALVRHVSSLLSIDAGPALDASFATRIRSALDAYYWRARALTALSGATSLSFPAAMASSSPSLPDAAHVEALLAVLGAPSIDDMVQSMPLCQLLASWVSAAAGGDSSDSGESSGQAALNRRPQWSLPDVRAERRIGVRPTPRPLCALPFRFTDLYKQLAHHKCASTKAFPEDPAICLLCGEVLCAGTACCKRDGKGALTQHVQSCGAGCGIFFLVHRCDTVLLRGPHAAYSISPYVDGNGEEDVGLRRGRPLYLDQGRIHHLYRLWAQHLTAREVVRERVMRERVIREAYY